MIQRRLLAASLFAASAVAQMVRVSDKVHHGGLIFGGDANGRFRALDQDTGKVLWEINLGAPVTGYPVTYAANGKQYVAVSTGTSLVSVGVNRMAPELKPGTNNAIFVFALP